jgi:hypothetical protein
MLSRLFSELPCHTESASIFVCMYVDLVSFIARLSSALQILIRLFCTMQSYGLHVKYVTNNVHGGTRSRSWLMHYATRQEVEVSIPDGVIRFFNWPNPSSRTMTLVSIQPLTEMSTRNIPGGVKDGGRVRLTTLPLSMSRLCRENVEASTSHNPMGLQGMIQG